MTSVIEIERRVKKLHLHIRKVRAMSTGVYGLLDNTLEAMDVALGKIDFSEVKDRMGKQNSLPENLAPNTKIRVNRLIPEFIGLLGSVVGNAEQPNFYHVKLQTGQNLTLHRSALSHVTTRNSGRKKVKEE